MGFDRAWVDISCDACGLESEPEELPFTVASGGGYSLEGAREALRHDGWLVDESDRVTCADCAALA
jgi:hypothetical protein